MEKLSVGVARTGGVFFGHGEPSVDESRGAMAASDIKMVTSVQMTPDKQRLKKINQRRNEESNSRHLSHR